MSVSQSDDFTRRLLRKEYQKYKADAERLVALFDANPWPLDPNMTRHYEMLEKVIFSDRDECFGPTCYTYLLRSAASAGRVFLRKRDTKERNCTTFDVIQPKEKE